MAGTPEQRTQWNRTYYQKNGRSKIDAHTRRYKERNLLYMRKVKESTPCSDCDSHYPHYVMDFDHLPGCDKVDDVARLAHRPCGMEKLKAEIAKCEVVCSNCHRIRTWKRRQS